MEPQRLQEDEPMESCSRWVSLLFRYGMWPRCSDKAPKTSASAARLRLMNEVSLSARPVTPDIPGGGRNQAESHTITKRARKSSAGSWEKHALGKFREGNTRLGSVKRSFSMFMSSLRTSAELLLEILSCFGYRASWCTCVGVEVEQACSGLQ